MLAYYNKRAQHNIVFIFIFILCKAEHVNEKKVKISKFFSKIFQRLQISQSFSFFSAVVRFKILIHSVRNFIGFKIDHNLLHFAFERPKDIRI